MFKNIKLNREGFTIVETLIVLAIAAVIIIIVLLAVPALQRTARNNDIKTDATTVAGEIGEFESDNNGSTPTTISNSGATLTVSGSTGTTPVTAQVSSNDHISSTSGANGVSVTYSGNGIAVGVIKAYTGVECTGGTNTVTGGVDTYKATVANTNAFAVLYPIEVTGSTGSIGCVQG